MARTTTITTSVHGKYELGGRIRGTAVGTMPGTDGPAPHGAAGATGAACGVIAGAGGA